MPHSILFLITGLFPGGAETQLLLLAQELASRGWKPTVVSMISEGPLQATLEASGIKVSSLGMRRGVPDPRAVLRMSGILRAEAPDILHTHMVHANLLGRVSRLFAPVPVVISTAHSVTEGARWKELAYRVTDRLTDLTTIVSGAAAKRYIRIGAVPSNKLKVVPNGVPLQTFQCDAETRARMRKSLGVEDRFTWLAVGRLDIPKDYPNLLAAIARLSKGSILLIAGDGPLRESIERFATDVGISDRIRFLGILRDIPALMTAADAYVMSSAWEGLPMVLLEASASALPIVATDVGGNSEIVLEGINGFLVPAKSPEALAEAMLRIEQLSTESRRSLGLAGREHVAKHYSLPSVVDQWEQIYESLLRREYQYLSHSQPISQT
jgi:glycosyltransferase involved in cell wall biosynthesis